MELTHASFFSGVGGLDLGLERAGWRTVSFSEIDPYASAVLAQRWPGVVNLGDIVQLAGSGGGGTGAGAGLLSTARDESDGWTAATLWSGGFPCQDLSVAGKRRGMGAGTRSGLAFAFLDLVAVHRPRAVLLENVPGLLSSHGGRDMAALVGALVELGYGVGYRVLDARHFGVPQRRRRVFILGLTPGGRAGAERAAEVLSVGSRCRRHPPTGIEAGPGVAVGTGGGAGLAGNLTRRYGKGINSTLDDGAIVYPESVGALNDLGHHGWTANAQSVDAGHVIPVLRAVGNRYGDRDERQLVSQAPDPDGVRAPDGLAGRLDDRGGVEYTTALSGGLGSGGPDAAHAQAGWLIPQHYRKSTRAASVDHDETWVPDDLANTLNGFDIGDARTVELVTGVGAVSDDGLPLGLDSHRYRCCGNGVVSSVAEWIGYRLAEALA